MTGPTLDSDQLEAVRAPRGPVCILAGAGTGKTRTITHRIARLIADGQVDAGQVLAVTFTTRAAGEMRERIEAMNPAGDGRSVSVRTFHAAARQQLSYFWPRAFGEARWQLLDRRGAVVARAAQAEGLTADPELVADLSSEIGWAKATLVDPAGYPAAAASAGRSVPKSPEIVGRVFRRYEELKVSPAGDFLLDFDDLLLFTTQLLLSVPNVAEEFRDRYRSFVVDEYQDVTPAQQGLLNAWLGERDDLTVVGDANQTIYSFTGATPGYLLDFTRRFPHAKLIRLQRDYRSTPQVVDLANRVIGAARGRIAGTRLRLIGQRPDGPAPVLREHPDPESEAAAVVEEISRLHAAGTPLTEMAVLYRVNAASQVFEEALTAAGLAYDVRDGGGFFRRPSVTGALRQLNRWLDNPLPPELSPADAVRRVLHGLGLTETVPGGERARARHAELTELARIADELSADPAVTDYRSLVVALNRRAAEQHTGRSGVTLSSLHAAKGLEWDAVFLTGLQEGSLPLARTMDSPEAIEEERRLFYVGVTRAREHLTLSWAASRGGGRSERRRSRFLDGITARDGRILPVAQIPHCDNCGAELADAQEILLGRCRNCPAQPDPAVREAVNRWREEYAAEHGLRPAVVLTGTTVQAIAERLPADRAELTAIPGFGATQFQRYGPAILEIVRHHRSTPDHQRTADQPGTTVSDAPRR